MYSSKFRIAVITLNVVRKSSSWFFFHTLQSFGWTPPPSPSQQITVAMVESENDPNGELDLCDGGKDAFVVEVRCNT